MSQLLKCDSLVNAHLNEPLEFGNVKYSRAIDYLSGDNGDEKPGTHEGVFALGMPGVMSMEELRIEVDLGAWLIQIGDQLVLLQV